MTCWCGKMFCGRLCLTLSETIPVSDPGGEPGEGSEFTFGSWVCLMRYAREKANESKFGGRCPKCVSVGILPDGKYCECEIGRDLERVQRRNRIVGDEPMEPTRRPNAAPMPSAREIVNGGLK
jgi:hypothetical protein